MCPLKVDPLSKPSSILLFAKITHCFILTHVLLRILDIGYVYVFISFKIA